MVDRQMWPLARVDKPLQDLLLRAELAAHIERHAALDRRQHQLISWLSLTTGHPEPSAAASTLKPGLHVTAFGRRCARLGSSVLSWGEKSFLLSLEPGVAVEPPPDGFFASPHSSLAIHYDPAEVSSLLQRLHRPAKTLRLQEPFHQGAMTKPLLEAVVRLIRLLDTPLDIASLGPLIKTEVLYRAVTSPTCQREPT